MKLANAADTLALAGLLERAGSNTAAVEMALETVTSQLASSIHTDFDRAERTDYFGVGVRNIGTRSSPQYILNLTQGFLDANEDVSVYAADIESATEDDVGIVRVTDSNVSKLSELKYSVDAQKGRVFVYYPDVIVGLRRTVAVRYTAGFAEGDDGVATGVHPKVKHAAMILALRMLRVGSGPRPKTKDEFNITDLSYSARDVYASLIRSFLTGAIAESSEVG
jgi:hypothetical protein